MSAVPPVCFDWPRGSGQNIYYGGVTISTGGNTRTYHGNRDIIYSGNGVPGHFQQLDNEFRKNPSGWNQGIKKPRGGVTIGGRPEPLFFIPSGSPSLAVWADTFTPTFGTIGSSPPEIGPVLKQGQPGDAIPLTGDFASDISFESYTQTTGGNGAFTELSTYRIIEDKAVVALDESTPTNSLALIYVQKTDGTYSVPTVINRAELWWAISHNIGRNSIIPGDTVSLFGRNLSKVLNYTAGSGYDVSDPSNKCDIWLYTSYSGGLKVTCTDINPYRAQFVMPRILPSGTSSTAISYTTGSKTLTTQADLLYTSGLPVTIYNSVSGYMNGTVVSYASTTLGLNITAVEDGVAGTANRWFIEPRYDVAASVHNGHGGDYGWSNTIDFSISNYPALVLNYDKNIINIASPGGLSDISKISTEITTLGNNGPATLVLQSGTYQIPGYLLLSGGFGKNIKLLGQGSGITNLMLGSGGVLATTANTQFSSLSILCPSGLGVGANSRFGGLINNCYIRTSGTNLQSTYIVDSTVINNTTELSSNSYVNNCDFYGTNLADQLVFTWGGSNIAFTNNTGQHLNSNSPGPNYLEMTHGRFFVGAPQFQSTLRNHYIANNSTPTRLNNPQEGFGDGEIFLYDGCNGHYSSLVTSATINTMILGSGNTDWINEVQAVIVDGRGIGQSRLVTNISGETYTLAENWDIVPDATSRVNIIKTISRIVIYDNQVIGGNISSSGLVHGNSQGFQAFTGGNDIIVDDNVFTDMNYGYSEWAIGETAVTSPNLPLFFNIYQNNTFDHSNYGVRTVIEQAQEGETCTAFGNVRRNNLFSNTVTAGWLWHTMNNLLDGDIIQNSIFSGMQYGIYNNAASGITAKSNIIDTTFYGTMASGSYDKVLAAVTEQGTTSFQNFINSGIILESLVQHWTGTEFSSGVAPIQRSGSLPDSLVTNQQRIDLDDSSSIPSGSGIGSARAIAFNGSKYLRPEATNTAGASIWRKQFIGGNGNRTIFARVFMSGIGLGNNNHTIMCAGGDNFRGWRFSIRTDGGAPDTLKLDTQTMASGATFLATSLQEPFITADQWWSVAMTYNTNTVSGSGIITHYALQGTSTELIEQSSLLGLRSLEPHAGTFIGGDGGDFFKGNICDIFFAKEAWDLNTIRLIHNNGVPRDFSEYLYPDQDEPTPAPFSNEQITEDWLNTTETSTLGLYWLRAWRMPSGGLRWFFSTDHVGAGGFYTGTSANQSTAPSSWTLLTGLTPTGHSTGTPGTPTYLYVPDDANGRSHYLYVNYIMTSDIPPGLSDAEQTYLFSSATEDFASPVYEGVVLAASVATAETHGYPVNWLGYSRVYKEGDLPNITGYHCYHLCDRLIAVIGMDKSSDPKTFPVGGSTTEFLDSSSTLPGRVNAAGVQNMFSPDGINVYTVARAGLTTGRGVALLKMEQGVTGSYNPTGEMWQLGVLDTDIYPEVGYVQDIMAMWENDVLYVWVLRGYYPDNTYEQIDLWTYDFPA
jgi:hypothetical protein